jgi:HrpA-like RNA helicase
MSATVNAALFSSYFDDAPTLNIPGFMYAVTDHYLEDVLDHCMRVRTSDRPRGVAETVRSLVYAVVFFA